MVQTFIIFMPRQLHNVNWMDIVMEKFGDGCFASRVVCYFGATGERLSQDGFGMGQKFPELLLTQRLVIKPYAAVYSCFRDHRKEKGTILRQRFDRPMFHEKFVSFYRTLIIPSFMHFRIECALGRVAICNLSRKSFASTKNGPFEITSRGFLVNTKYHVSKLEFLRFIPPAKTASSCYHPPPVSLKRQRCICSKITGGIEPLNILDGDRACRARLVAQPLLH